MYNNHRDSFGNRNQDDDQRDDPASRWRRGEERYRREASGDNRFEDDRSESGRRGRDFGYGRSFRDDDYGGRGSFGRDDWREQRSYNTRAYYGAQGAPDDGQPVHWHEHNREQRSGHPYQGTYGGTGDSRYFTGQQGSWAVGAPRAPSPVYGGDQHFGADYRAHGYAGGGYGQRDHRDRDDQRGFWDRATDEVASWFGDEDAARRREQDHRGHGPKDYTRSDERIREDANDKLTEDWRVDASNVTVAVKDGEITLNGTVTSREAKRRAEDVVDNVSGVKHVQNNLRVQAETATSGSAYTGNWATNATSTAEGGTLSRSATETAKTTDKI